MSTARGAWSPGAAPPTKAVGSRNLGLLAATAAATSWGFTGIFVGKSVTGPLLLTFYRLWLAGLHRPKRGLGSQGRPRPAVPLSQPGGYPGAGGGLWLRMIFPPGLFTSLVPSGKTVSCQPIWCRTT